MRRRRPGGPRGSARAPGAAAGRHLAPARVFRAAWAPIVVVVPEGLRRLLEPGCGENMAGA